MRVRLALVVMASTVVSSMLPAQDVPQADRSSILQLERSFGSPEDSAVVELRKGVMYWAEVDGPGYPELRSTRRYDFPALVVDADPPRTGIRRFEVHAGRTGPYVVRLTGRSPGQAATFRLYRDEAETKRVADLRDLDFAIGILLGGGGHTGYRLAPAAEDPGGGRQFEGGIITQSGSWFSALIGLCRQSLHDPDLAVAWFFLEPRAQIASGRLLGSSRSDVAVSLRVAAAPETGPFHLPPNLIAPGVTFTQHLSSDGRRRGFSLYTSWRHGWISNVPESEHNTTDEFSAGLTWVP